MVQLLVENPKININACDSHIFNQIHFNDDSSLHISCKNNYFDIAVCLINHGIDINMSNKKGF